jgi:phosphoglycerol transferase MdoB-like AlkP superfamily enzyme
VETGFENCLPKRLLAAGYKTAAMHGATSLMYDRRHWYPRAGFEKMTFFEDRVWPQRCYSFPGACDLDMLPELEKFFGQPGKRFMYWLTLNSHAPYDLRDLRVDHFNCAAHGISDNTEVCRLLKLQADFFSGLAQQLRSDTLKGVDVIIVGDHAPSLINLEDKTAIFAPSVVPWVRLKTQS